MTYIAHVHAISVRPRVLEGLLEAGCQVFGQMMKVDELFYAGYALLIVVRALVHPQHDGGHVTENGGTQQGCKGRQMIYRARCCSYTYLRKYIPNLSLGHIFLGLLDNQKDSLKYITQASMTTPILINNINNSLELHSFKASDKILKYSTKETLKSVQPILQTDVERLHIYKHFNIRGFLTLLMWPCSEIENEGIITVKVQNKRIINFS